MKALITDAYSASNIGDLELVAKSVYVCRQRFPGVEPVCIATDPISFAGTVDVEVRESVFSRLSYVNGSALTKIRFIISTVFLIAIITPFAFLGTNVLAACIKILARFSLSAQRLSIYVDADTVIAVGGGYFTNAYLKHSFLTLWVWWVASKLGASVETMPVSMEINSGWFKPVIAALGRDVAWRIRDSHSLKMLRDCGLNGELVPDLAFINFGTVIIDDPSLRRRAIMVAPVGGDYLTPAEASYLFKALAIMVHEEFSDYEVLLLAMHSSMQGTHIGGDQLACSELLAELLNLGIKSEIVPISKYAELVSVCAQMDIVISARMHAGIAALCAGARVGLLAYEEKHTSLMHDLSLDDYAIPIRAKESDVLALGRRLRASSRDEFIARTRLYHSQVGQLQ